MISVWPTFTIALHVLLIVVLVSEILIRKRGTSDARLAWIVFIVLAPIAGAIAYLLFGGTWISGIRRRRHKRIHAVFNGRRSDDVRQLQRIEHDIPTPYDQVFALAGRISDTDVSGGNALTLTRGPDGFAAQFIADIDAARSTVHILTFIYLDDEIGRAVADALLRAVQRGVVVRLQVDSIGSKDFLKSQTIGRLRQGGVQINEMLPASVFRLMIARMDIRNHRKLAIFDNTTAWVGSRNIASPAFAPKARYAPWVDCTASLRGPAVHDLQALFLEDWYIGTGECIDDLLCAPAVHSGDNACCQVIGTGPNCNNEALPQLLQACFHVARTEILLTTPYFVLDAATAGALRAAAMRGVRVQVIVPARNDSRLVALASRSHYPELIASGIELIEFQAGVLHAKTMTVDDGLFMIGSANLDRRSLELNFEVSLLGWSESFTSEFRYLQRSYLNDATPVDTARWLNMPPLARLGYNAVGLLSPLL